MMVHIHKDLITFLLLALLFHTHLAYLNQKRVKFRRMVDCNIGTLRQQIVEYNKIRLGSNILIFMAAWCIYYLWKM